MNSGDVFILDLGLTIYVWNGKESGRLEKIKGLEVARRIRDEERGGRASLEPIGTFTLLLCVAKNHAEIKFGDLSGLIISKLRSTTETATTDLGLLIQKPNNKSA